MRPILLLPLLVLLPISTVHADMIHYAGSLSSLDGGLQGTGFWPNYNGAGTTIEWLIEDSPDGMWTYTYTLTVPRADVSHFILEVSGSFLADDAFNVSGLFDTWYVATHPGSPGVNTQPNPYMPGDLYGIKFDSTTGTTVEISFNSYRTPVWGDFYAKCGNVGGTQNTIWNTGFLAADPTAPAADGSLNNHLLVPDSVDTRVPEPGTLALLGLGLPALRLLRRRKTS